MVTEINPPISENFISLYDFPIKPRRALEWDKEHKASDRLPSVEEIDVLLNQALKDGALLEKLRVQLNKARDSLTPDFIMRLFQVTQVESRSSNPDDEMDPLSKAFPKWFSGWLESQSGQLAIESALALLPGLNSSRAEKFPRLLKLAQWMQEAQAEFQQCIDSVFFHLDTLRQTIDEFPQPFEMSSDLGTKSPIELLEIFLSPHLPIRRRFDALLILVHAIGLFHIRQNPVFQLRLAVLNDINSLLNHKWWPHRMAYARIPLRAMSSDTGTRFKVILEGAGERADKEAIPRAVNDEVTTILSKWPRVIKDPGHVIFRERAKGGISALIKILLRQERLREAFAKNADYDVNGMSGQDADAILQERRLLMDKKDDVMTDKPASFELVRDVCGLTFGFVVNKSLEDFDDRDQANLNACFSEIMEYLTMVLHLKNVRIRNRLWPAPHSHTNASRDAGYRDFKFYAVREEQVKEGEAVRTVEVPVEVQLLPIQTFAEAASRGSPAHHKNYDERRSRRLARLIAPTKIGDVDLFPPYSSARIDFSKALSAIAS